MQARFEGPYRIVQVNANKVTYELLKPGSDGPRIKAHYNQLKKFRPPPQYLRRYFEDPKGAEPPLEAAEDYSLKSWEYLSDGAVSEPSSSSSWSLGICRDNDRHLPQGGTTTVTGGAGLTWVQLCQQIKKLPDLPHMAVSSTPTKDACLPDPNFGDCTSIIPPSGNSPLTDLSVNEVSRILGEQRDVIESLDSLLQRAGGLLDQIQQDVHDGPRVRELGTTRDLPLAVVTPGAPETDSLSGTEFLGFSQAPTPGESGHVVVVAPQPEGSVPINSQIVKTRAAIECYRRRSRSRLVNLYRMANFGGNDGSVGYATRSRGPVCDVPNVQSRILEYTRPMRNT